MLDRQYEAKQNKTMEESAVWYNNQQNNKNNIDNNEMQSLYETYVEYQRSGCWGCDIGSSPLSNNSNTADGKSPKNKKEEVSQKKFKCRCKEKYSNFL